MAPEFGSISAVLLLNPVSHSGPVEYRRFFVPNEAAPLALPEVVLEGLLAGNADPQGPRWSRE